MPNPTGITQLPDGQLKVTFDDGSAYFALPVVPLAADGSVQASTTDSAPAPGALLHHRSALSLADGSAAPAASAGGWAVNAAHKRKARVFVTTTGSPTTCQLRPYLRSGGSSGQVSMGSLVYLNGSPNYSVGFDVQVDGDDLLVYLEQLAGGSSPSVDIWLSWR